MKNQLLLLLALVFVFSSCTNNNKQEATDSTEEVEVQKEEAPALNTLSQEELDEGWVLLFDGKSNEGWRRYNENYFPEGWVIEEGTLHCKSSGRGEEGGIEGGDIIFDKKFSNFHFKFDWKISKGGNSGVLYLGQERPDHAYMWKNAPEYQVLDNINHPDAEEGIQGNRKAGALYDLIPADPQTAKEFGNWNVGEIIVKDGKVEHRLNGATVLTYELWSSELETLIAGSKWAVEAENWGDIASEGVIGLQDHGDDVWYRNLKIKEL